MAKNDVFKYYLKTWGQEIAGLNNKLKSFIKQIQCNQSQYAMYNIENKNECEALASSLQEYQDIIINMLQPEASISDSVFEAAQSLYKSYKNEAEKRIAAIQLKRFFPIQGHNWREVHLGPNFKLFLGPENLNQMHAVKIKMLLSNNSIQEILSNVAVEIIRYQPNCDYIDLCDNQLKGEDLLGLLCSTGLQSLLPKIEVLVLSNNAVDGSALFSLLDLLIQHSKKKQILLDRNMIDLDNEACNTLQRYIEKPCLAILDLSMNFIPKGYMIENEGMRIYFRKNQMLDEMHKRHVNGESRTHIKDKFLDPSNIVRSIPQAVNSLLIDCSIDITNGIIGLYKINIGDDTQQVSFFVEGIRRRFAQRYIIRGDLTLESTHTSSLRMFQISPQELLRFKNENQHLDFRIGRFSRNKIKEVLTKICQPQLLYSYDKSIELMVFAFNILRAVGIEERDSKVLYANDPKESIFVIYNQFYNHCALSNRGNSIVVASKSSDACINPLTSAVMARLDDIHHKLPVQSIAEESATQSKQVIEANSIEASKIIQLGEDVVQTPLKEDRSMNNGQDSSTSATQSSPAMTLATSTAPAASQSAADLDWLLKLWSETWAHKRGTTINWLAYKELDVERLLSKKSELRKTVHFLSIKPVNRDNVQTIDEPEMLSDLKVVSGGFELALSNDSATPQSSKKTLRRILTSQESFTWTTSMTTTAGLEFGGGIPGIAATKVTVSAALLQSRISQTITTKSDEHAFEQPINAQPWKKILAAVFIQERRVRRRFEVKVELTGGVVICCNNKVKMPGRDDTHEKGYVPISIVFQDLQSYVTSAVISQIDKEKLRESLLHFELDGTGVRFILRGESQIEEMMNPIVQIREEDILNLDQTTRASVTAIAESSGSGSRVIMRGTALSEGGGPALNMTNEQDYAPARHTELLEVVSILGPRGQYYQGGAITRTRGAPAIVLSENAPPAAQALAAQIALGMFSQPPIEQHPAGQAASTEAPTSPKS
jgi:hypothetical protein